MVDGEEVALSPEYSEVRDGWDEVVQDSAALSASCVVALDGRNLQRNDGR